MRAIHSYIRDGLCGGREGIPALAYEARIEARMRGDEVESVGVGAGVRGVISAGTKKTTKMEDVLLPELLSRGLQLFFI